jgi:hypothetical protein
LIEEEHLTLRKDYIVPRDWDLHQMKGANKRRILTKTIRKSYVKAQSRLFNCHRSKVLGLAHTRAHLRPYQDFSMEGKDRVRNSTMKED